MLTIGTESFKDEDFLLYLSIIHLFFDLTYSDNFAKNDLTDLVNYQSMSR